MATEPSKEAVRDALANAEAGDVDAQKQLAEWYEQGNGVEKDLKQSVYWYQQAAEQDDAFAMFMLAMKYSAGEGTGQDHHQAFYWFHKATEIDSDDQYALYQVGLAYFEGVGVDQDYQKAADYFKRAADNKQHPMSTYYIGQCYAKGLGVAKDKALAMHYLKLAAAEDVDNAQSLMDELQKEPRPFAEAMHELESLIGLADVKNQVKRLSDRLALLKQRKEHGLAAKKPDLHIIFSGNPGTGKTTVARIIGDIFFHIGLLSKGHVVEVSPTELISSYVGQSAKNVKEYFEKAKGGILFIDEAYGLCQDSTSSTDAINALLKLMEDLRDEVVVIAAGYKASMDQFLKANPGLTSRFTTRIEFQDFNAEELKQVFLHFCQTEQYELSAPAEAKLTSLIKEVLSTKIDHFGNARFMRNVFNESMMKHAERIVKIQEKTKDDLIVIAAEDIPEKKEVVQQDTGKNKRLSYEEAMNELTNMIGLRNVKNVIKLFIDQVELQKARSQRGIKSEKINAHMIFTGNPGTGKTTVARLLGDILRELGILKTGHVVETDQSDLIAGFVGQTAIKTKEVFTKALGGILFIDEAYSLIQGGGEFGTEAINTLLKLMEDHRDEIVVIAAGYKKEMHYFISNNPGLESRFTTFVEFEDYDQEELEQIFQYFCAKNHYQLSEEAQYKLSELLTHVLSLHPENFSNGRFIRNAFQTTTMNLAHRVASMKDPADADFINITAQDIPAPDDVKLMGDGKRKIGFT